MTLLAAFTVLLSRYSGQTDVVVGTPVANRPRPELEGLIGFFVNTLALRTDLSGEPSFVEVLRRVKETCLGGYAHQELPFERLVEALQPERDVRYHPVYQVMFVLQNAPVAAHRSAAACSWCRCRWRATTSKFDLTLSVEESGDGLAATLEYSTELFEPALAEPMLAHFGALLPQASWRRRKRATAALPLLPAEERERCCGPERDAARVPARNCCITRCRAAGCGAARRHCRQLRRGDADLRRSGTPRQPGSRTSCARAASGRTRWSACALERSLELVVGLLGDPQGGRRLPAARPASTRRPPRVHARRRRRRDRADAASALAPDVCRRRRGDDRTRRGGAASAAA